LPNVPSPFAEEHHNVPISILAFVVHRDVQLAVSIEIRDGGRERVVSSQASEERFCKKSGDGEGIDRETSPL
jgi:hypothetical protein